MTLVDAITLGMYVGVLTGVFTGFLSFLLAFGFQYVAGVKLSDRVGLFIGLGVVGLQGSRLYRDPDFLRSPAILSALLVVMLLTLFAHQKGVDLGKRLPKGTLTRRLWKRTLSSDAIERIGRFGQVRVRITGEVDDVEGYPPLPDRLRTEIAEGSWTFPADLPLAELESRLADRLRSEYELAAVRVGIDADGRATVAAAPLSGGLSRRIPPDRRGVSVDATLPAGLARGDEVELAVGEEWIRGSVVSAMERKPEAERADAPETTDREDETDRSSPDEAGRTDTASTGTPGGEGRATVAIPSEQIETVVDGDVRGLLARSRGGGPEFELVTLLRRGGEHFRKLTVRPGSDGDGMRLADMDLRREYGVDVLALRRADGWTFAPAGATALRAEDDLFAVGPQTGLAALAEVVA